MERSTVRLEDKSLMMRLGLEDRGAMSPPLKQQAESNEIQMIGVGWQKTYFLGEGAKGSLVFE